MNAATADRAQTKMTKLSAYAGKGRPSAVWYFPLASKKLQKKHKTFGKTEDFAPLMAPTGGFEPLAYRLGGGRSIQLSYAGLWNYMNEIELGAVHLCPRSGALYSLLRKQLHKSRPGGPPLLSLFILPQTPASVNGCTASFSAQSYIASCGFFCYNTSKRRDAPCAM